MRQEDLHVAGKWNSDRGGDIEQIKHEIIREYHLAKSHIHKLGFGQPFFDQLVYVNVSSSVWLHNVLNERVIRDGRVYKEVEYYANVIVSFRFYRSLDRNEHLDWSKSIGWCKFKFIQDIYNHDYDINIEGLWELEEEISDYMDKFQMDKAKDQ